MKDPIISSWAIIIINCNGKNFLPFLLNETINTLNEWATIPSIYQPKIKSAHHNHIQIENKMEKMRIRE